jgi:hypothetical protein
VTANGVSNEEQATISNPGIAEHVAAIDTTPNVPRLEFAASGAAERFFVEQLAAARTQQSTQITSGGGELAATAERYLQLCMIRPDGRPEKCFRIKDESLFNLRGLFATLPDGRYQVFIIRTENNSRRMVIEVDVRRGQLVDAWDDSEGTRDRPPTSEAPAAGPAGGAVPLEQNPLLEPLPEQGRPNQAPADVDAACDCEGDPLVAPLQSAPTIVGPESGPGATGSVGLGLAGLGLAAGGAGGWSRRVDAALAAADRRDWERLRRAGRMGRVFAGP